MKLFIRHIEPVSQVDVKQARRIWMQAGPSHGQSVRVLAIRVLGKRPQDPQTRLLQQKPELPP
jgi:hypothetical protein